MHLDRHCLFCSFCLCASCPLFVFFVCPRHVAFQTSEDVGGILRIPLCSMHHLLRHRTFAKRSVRHIMEKRKPTRKSNNGDRVNGCCASILPSVNKSSRVKTPSFVRSNCSKSLFGEVELAVCVRKNKGTKNQTFHCPLNSFSKPVVETRRGARLVMLLGRRKIEKN